MNQYGVRDVEAGSDGSITVHLTENEISGKLIILKRAAYRGVGYTVSDGDALSGEKPIEGVKVELEELDFVSSVWYRVYVDGMGWTAWARDGEACGTSGYGAPVLAVQVTVQIRDVAHLPQVSRATSIRPTC